MALRSFNEEELKKARDARQQILISRWLKRARLSRLELDEIRSVIGEEEYAKALAAGDQPLPVGERGQYLHELKEYAATYKRSARQIKRWIKAGREAKPPDMPPLDHPGKMLAWWSRMQIADRLKQKPPAILEQFAIDEAKGEPGGELSAINIGELEVKEGAALQQARRFLVATGKQLEDAYAAGQDAVIGRVQLRWEKSLGAVRLAEESERKAALARGDSFPKHEVLSELSQLIETIRNMQSTMSRRIRARLGMLPAEVDAKLDEAIEAERARESAALRRAKYFQSIGEIILELDQASGVAA
jgi:hypothetical protein